MLIAPLLQAITQAWQSMQLFLIISAILFFNVIAFAEHTLIHLPHPVHFSLLILTAILLHKFSNIPNNPKFGSSFYHFAAFCNKCALSRVIISELLSLIFTIMAILSFIITGFMYLIFNLTV